jgi:predicted aldo/keto reductase-like oxidoreductase
MKKLNASLLRLQTDYVDIYFNHAVNDIARLKNDEWFEFVELAKKQGKIRFSGMSGHGGHLIECLDYAIDNDLVDVILAAHNFGQDPAFYEQFLKSLDIVAVQVELPRVFAKAHAKGIGVIAMKTLMGAKLNDLRPYEKAGGTYSQAAFRWVLSNPDVDALIVSMNSEENIDEYVKASGTATLTADDVELLKRYAMTNGLSYCRHGCNACIDSCAEGVPIPELLRTRMYATDYGDLALARGSYLELGDAASPCLTCTTPTCVGACPVGIDIPSRTRTLPALLRG